MKKSLLALFLCLFYALPAVAETSVWMVEKDGARAYLGGTSHLLRSTDYPLPKEFSSAYDAADTVVFEVNPGEIGSPDFQREVMTQAIYPEGKGLDQVLSKETYSRLIAEAGKVGLEAAAIRRMKPAMVTLALLSAELAKLGVTQRGVDFHFYERAVTDGKSLGALETPKEQIGFIFKLGEGDEDNFIRYMLEDIGRTGEVIDPMIDAWRAGDTAAIDRLALADMREQFPDVYKMLIVDRNERWEGQIEKLIASPPTELILVGVGHLVGQDGLVRVLRSRGYKVQKMP